MVETPTSPMDTLSNPQSEGTQEYIGNQAHATLDIDINQQVANLNAFLVENRDGIITFPQLKSFLTEYIATKQGLKVDFGGSPRQHAILRLFNESLKSRPEFVSYIDNLQELPFGSQGYALFIKNNTIFCLTVMKLGTDLRINTFCLDSLNSGVWK